MQEYKTFKISSIGFCFGGMVSLDLARINCGISSAVSFHGAFQPIDGETDFSKMDPITAKLLIAHKSLKTLLPLFQDFPKSRNQTMENQISRANIFDCQGNCF